MTELFDSAKPASPAPAPKSLGSDDDESTRLLPGGTPAPKRSPLPIVLALVGIAVALGVGWFVVSAEPPPPRAVVPPAPAVAPSAPAAAPTEPSPAPAVEAAPAAAPSP